MLLNVGVDTGLTPVSSYYSVSSCIKPQERKKEENGSVSVEDSLRGPTQLPSCVSQKFLETEALLNSSRVDSHEEQRNQEYQVKDNNTRLVEESKEIHRMEGVDIPSSEIQYEELELIKSAVEKVLHGNDSTSESNDEAMDTDSLDNQQLTSSDSLSDVTPENENIPVATTDCAFVCPNFDRTVIILDWDDTLLSSSWLASEGLKVDDTQEVPEVIRHELNELEELVLNLLMECCKHGIVSIVTNAETGWVELSSKKFIPRVFSYIEEGIRVVSARSNFEKEFPDSPAEWKEKAFLLELSRLPVDLTCLNLLVLGDSLNERNAGHVAGTVYVGSYVKNVKFIERPTIEQLKRQLSLVISSLHHLCDHEGSFDVNMVC